MPFFRLQRFQGEEFLGEDGERWKRIAGHLEYAVSDAGRVWSFKRWGTLLRPGKRGEYLVVLCDQQPFAVHGLVARAFVAGCTTARNQIDHVDGKKSNNHAWNLRWCSRAENAQNRTVAPRNGTGFTGVHPRVCGLRFQARIRIAGRVESLGDFDTAREAALVYARRAQALHGDFLAPHTRQLLEEEERRLMAAQDTGVRAG
jgi:hypothetical protein